MTTKFNLSEKVLTTRNCEVFSEDIVYADDVREFIRLLRKEYLVRVEKADSSIEDLWTFDTFLDKLAGDKLI